MLIKLVLYVLFEQNSIVIVHLCEEIKCHVFDIRLHSGSVI